MEENCSRSEDPSAEMESAESEDKENPPTEDADETETEPEPEPEPFKKPAVISVPAVSIKKLKSLLPESSSSSLPIRPRAQQDGPENPDSTQEHDLKPSSQIQPDPPTATKKAPAAEKPNQSRTKPKVQVKVPPSGKFPPLPYTEPPWAGVVALPYAFELLKNGSILEKVPLSQQSYFVVGRLPVCDISLEHPSISRYHAVVQYRAEGVEDGELAEEPGFYVYDLGSTHGTVVNKNKIPPKTYIRLRVGHVVKFGGSTRLFILQGPESDEEAESELTVTELKEKARRQREELEKRMTGYKSDDDDDDDDDDDEDDKKKPSESITSGKSPSEDAGCSWGMEEDVAPEEDENEENPFATEFQEDQEAAYLKDPKKALQGFYDREGEELEFEYDDKGHGTWLCRIRLPVDDAMGRQLVAEVTHPGKKKEAAVQCCLEACRMLEARGLLRQEAVSRKRKKKNWEDEDFYDSDDDAYLDRTGTVEKKRNERMKKAGKIQERPETYDSLVNKLAEVQKELSSTERALRSSDGGGSSSSTDDPLDAFMSSVRSQASLDGVQRKKLHLHVVELKKEEQRLNRLIELTRPTALPSLQSRSESLSSDPEKPKKLALPLFGAMKGGSKFRLKTGAIGKLPLKRPNLPPELFNMKELPPGGEQQEEEEEEEEQESGEEKLVEPITEGEKNQSTAASEDLPVECRETRSSEPATSQSPAGKETSARQSAKGLSDDKNKEVEPKASADTQPVKKAGKRMLGPSRPPHPVMEKYPEDDPDYCVWVPPAGQSGDGRTHLNEKYGY